MYLTLNMMIVNFIVLTHGSNRSSEHMASLQSYIRDSLPNTFVLNSKSNERGTCDGIDKCAKRLFEEILGFYYYFLVGYDTIHFSICGHSLGGLIARYVIKLIYEHDTLRNALHPVGITLVSTPNLGSRNPSGNFLRSLANMYLKVVCDQTGDQLLLSNDLLYEMSSDAYLEALEWFPHKTLIAPTCGDKVVAHSSAMILHYRYFKESSYGDLSVSVAGYSGFNDVIYRRLLGVNSMRIKQELVDESTEYVADECAEQEYNPHMLNSL
jgi:hypothetical protein